jgi:hypothetical protein
MSRSVKKQYRASYSGGRDPGGLRFEAGPREIAHETLSGENKSITHKKKGRQSHEFKPQLSKKKRDRKKQYRI